MFDARRAGDHGAHIRVLQNPRNRQLADRAAQLVGHFAQLTDHVVFAGIGELLAQPVVTLQLCAAIGRYAVAVLAGEQAGCERAPGGEPEADVLVEPLVFLFDALAVEQVVLRLLHDRFVQMMPLSDLVSRADFVGAPFGGAPVQRLTARDHIAHGPDGFFDWRVRVRTMTEHQIDIIELQAFERRVDRVQQIFAVQCVVLVRRFVEPPEEFRRYHIAHARPRQFLERLAHDLFGLAAGVDLRVVEEVDSRIARGRKRLARRTMIHLIAVSNP
jgi:hypothetical protein